MGWANCQFCEEFKIVILGLIAFLKIFYKVQKYWFQLSRSGSHRILLSSCVGSSCAIHLFRVYESEHGVYDLGQSFTGA